MKYTETDLELMPGYVLGTDIEWRRSTGLSEADIRKYLPMPQTWLETALGVATPLLAGLGIGAVGALAGGAASAGVAAGTTGVATAAGASGVGVGISLPSFGALAGAVKTGIFGDILKLVPKAADAIFGTHIEDTVNAGLKAVAPFADLLGFSTPGQPTGPATRPIAPPSPYAPSSWGYAMPQDRPQRFEWSGPGLPPWAIGPTMDYTRPGQDFIPAPRRVTYSRRRRRRY